MSGVEQYDNTKLWKLVSETAGRTYQSVPTAEPVVWRRETLAGGVIVYRTGEYEIRGRLIGKADRRSYTVYRGGVELPLSFTGRLHIAQERARLNARGLDRMHVA